jgi:hypothetical protein
MIKTNCPQIFAGLLALCLGGCATSSIQHTWKAPSYTGGPRQKLAVLAVDERELLRQVLESHFVLNLTRQGQGAFVTYDLLTLPAIKADRESAAARGGEKNADAVLIIRLVDQATHANEVRVTPGYFAPSVTGYENADWYGYYSVAFTDMGTVWGGSSKDVYLETSLFDLKTGQRIWSALSQTVLKENADRVEEIAPLAQKIFAAMRKDGVIH